MVAFLCLISIIGGGPSQLNALSKDPFPIQEQSHTLENSSKQSLRLTPIDVAQLIITKSLHTQEINLNPSIAKVQMIRALQIFDWQFRLEFNREESRFEPFNGLPFNTGQSNMQSNFVIQKNLLTGTQLNFNINHNSTQFDLSAGSILPPTVNVWTSSIGFTQNLWRNYFGAGWRKEIAAQEKLYEITKLQRLEDLENLILDAIRKFWNLIIAELSYKEAIEAKNRYQTLLNNVRKKQSVGFANPGELVQVQAELEAKEQGVYRAEMNLNEIREQFLTQLQLPKDIVLDLKYPHDVHYLKAIVLEDFDIQQTRTIKLAQLRRESSEKFFESAKANQGPEVLLTGQYGIAGVDQSTQLARQEWLNAERPRFFIGVQINWAWGSNFQEEEYKSRRFQLEQDHIKYSRLLQELEDRKKNLMKKIHNQHQTLESLMKQKNYRKQAVRELFRSYELGRIEIRVLIDSINLAFSNDLEYLRALGDYQILLSEWLALKDELLISSSLN